MAWNELILSPEDTNLCLSAVQRSGSTQAVKRLVEDIKLWKAHDPGVGWAREKRLYIAVLQAISNRVVVGSEAIVLVDAALQAQS